jgi:PknH-like extracellular domain
MPTTGILLRVGAIAALGVLMAGCESKVTGSAHPASGASPAAATSPAPVSPPTMTAPAAPLVSHQQLSGLLPSPEQIEATVGTPNMVVAESHNTIGLIPDDYLSDMSCSGSIGDGTLPAYDDSPYLRVRIQDYKQPDSDSPLVTESAVLYQNVQDAQDQATAVVNGWAACANKVLEAKKPKTTVSFLIGSGVEFGGAHTMTYTRMVPGWNCGRGIASRNNVVVDVTACSATDSAEVVGLHAQALIAQIAQRVPA